MADTELPLANDPFDAVVDYNPVHHLNALFSQPSHLSSIRVVSSRLRETQDALNRSITSRIQQQRITDADCVKGIQDVQADLSELFTNIETVQNRALETEKSITEMTAEIKRLDSTKRNLTHSMTTLKRLQMLSSAYEQLRALKSTRQYKECAGLLAAVLQLMAHFKSYRSIGQIAELSKGVADLQRELLEQVCEDFELAFAKGEIQSKRATLSEACLVVDALGDHARQRLINWYCNTQLREYRQVFRGSEEAGSLDNIGRRYSWFNRMLKTYDSEHQILFPRDWRVNEMLANAFCEGTREDYRSILQKSMRRTDGQPPDVNLLLSCLQETLDFENSLERRFKTEESRSSFDSTGSSKPEKPAGFSQAISEAFEPYLSIWVESQDVQLAKLIPQYRQQPIKNSEEEYHAQMVLPSSTELFHSYRVTLAQCAKLSTGSRLLELSKTFAKYLDIYCQQVLFHLLAERGGASGPSIEDVAIIINTADYCYQTTNQLEERIRSRIDDDFKEQVDLQSSADAFMGIASTSVRTLVRKVEVDCEPAWREMRNISWSKLQTVGDQSPFMTSLIQRFKDRSSEILIHMHKQQYSRAFSDNLVDTLITAFVINIVACRPISESAAEQMLLDSYGLKAGLLSLTSLVSKSSAVNDSGKPSAPTATNPGLVKRVQSSMSRLDPLLKTLQVQPSPPEALVQAYLIHIHDRSEPNFRKILEMKGIRSRAEQTSLVELFNAHKDSPSYNAPGADKLLESSPILANLTLQPTSSMHGPSGSIGSAAALEGGSRVASLNLGLNPQATHSSPSLLSSSSAALQGAAAAGAGAVGAGAKTFDPAALGEKILLAARDGVSAAERFGSPNATGFGFGGGGSSGGGVASPPDGQVGGGEVQGGLNENLRNIGKFFRRDGSGLGFRRAGTPEGRRSLERR